MTHPFLRATAPLPAPPLPLVAALAGGSIALRGLDGNAGQALFATLYALLAGWLLLSPLYVPVLWRARGGALALLAAAWGWSALATVIAGGMGWPDYATPRLLRNFGAVAALLSGLLLARHPRGREPLLDALALMIAALTAAGLALWHFAPDLAPGHDNPAWAGRFAGLVGNANVNATLAGAAALWAGWRAVRMQGAWRWAMGLAGLVCLAGALASATRMISVLLAGLVLADWLAHRRPAPTAAVQRALGVGAGLAALLALQGAGMLAQRFATLDQGLAMRLTLWSHYGHMALLAPWAGYGLGSFPWVAAHFLPEPRVASTIWMVNSPHNLALQLLLTGGLPYLALLALAAWRIVPGVVARWRHGEEADRVLALMLALFVGESMVDIVLDFPASIGIFGLLLGLAWGGRER